MRKADKETYSRQLIGEKLREARMADNSPMTEEDAEYYRILAEARSNHASKENTRKSAKRRLLTSAASVLLFMAVAGGGFVLGTQSDVRASADPDDTRKVVQQGDNIVIGSGVSEDDENVGVVTKTYYDLEDVPEEIYYELLLLNGEVANIEKIKLVTNKEIRIVSITYLSKNQRKFEVKEEFNLKLIETMSIMNDVDKEYMINGTKVTEQSREESIICNFTKDSIVVDIIIPNELKNEKETILYGLLS